MGLNAFFVYTVCIGFGLSYSNALVLILAEGLIFVLLTVTGLRKRIFESLPIPPSTAAQTFLLTILTTALAFCMVDMFDTLDTLYAACERAGLMDENGNPLNMNEGMLSNAIATTVGALCGTSTVTTFSEVNAGVAAGGRTGLTSVFCGVFFFIAMFMSPIAQLVPSCTTAAALIYVGFLMLVSVKNINWNSLKVAIPAFLTLTVMPFTYNISYRIAFGLISYIVISIFCGDIKKIKGSSWIIAGLFIAMLSLTH